jgi:hypothetical protein
MSRTNRQPPRPLNPAAMWFAVRAAARFGSSDAAKRLHVTRLQLASACAGWPVASEVHERIERARRAHQLVA